MVKEKVKEFKCGICDYMSARKRECSEHMKRVHFKIKDVKCDLCDYAACTRSDVNDHKKAVHLKIRDHVCQTCGKGFVILSKLKV